MKYYSLQIVVDGDSPSIKFITANANLVMPAGDNLAINTNGPTHFEYHANIQTLFFIGNVGTTEVAHSLVVDDNTTILTFQVTGIYNNVSISCNGNGSSPIQPNGEAKLVLA